jgi:hypothetical protein
MKDFPRNNLLQRQTEANTKKWPCSYHWAIATMDDKNNLTYPCCQRKLVNRRTSKFSEYNGGTPKKTYKMGQSFPNQPHGCIPCEHGWNLMPVLKNDGEMFTKFQLDKVPEHILELYKINGRVNMQSFDSQMNLDYVLVSEDAQNNARQLQEASQDEVQ